MTASKQGSGKPQQLTVWQVFAYLRPVLPVKPRFTT